MVSALCLTPPRCSPRTIPAPGRHHTNPKHIIRVNYVFQEGPPVADNKCSYSFVTAKASKDNDRNTKPNSVICGDCDGNGAVLCSQCKGSGVNSVDIFDGQFKAGDSCWLCGGRKEMLCGNCNGAGFVGGFLSTYDQ